MSEQPKKRGRTTKIDPELTKKICDALRGGNYRQVAAQWAGIANETFSRWMGKTGEPYESFQKAVLDAEQSAEVRAVALIMKAAADDPKHAQWWLERKFPTRWGRTDKHMHSGPNGGPVAIVDVTQLSDEELERIIATTK